MTAAANARSSVADVDLRIGELRIRTLRVDDAPLVVAATSGESAPALWGPHPAGPYTRADAEAALAAWDGGSGQVSFGVLEHGRLVAGLGLMQDSASSAELAYWVRPEERRRGIALRAVEALTAWAQHGAGLTRIWLEIDPTNLPSLRIAERAGYRYERTLSAHCRSWTADRLERADWHDCQIWAHEGDVGVAV